MRVKTFTLLLLVMSLFAPVLGAVELKYKFRPGNVYEYDYSVTRSSKVAAFKTNSSQSPIKTSHKFTLRAIDFQEGAHIVDVIGAGGAFRRYVRENGALSGAPGETGESVPFLLSFPVGDWKVGERHQLQQTMTVGATSVPATWNMLLKSLDNDKQTAEILFNCSFKLPEDRLRRKEFAMKGRAIFNFEQGILQQSEWVSTYRFIFSNREMAVGRELWLFEHQSSSALTLAAKKD
ncbi:MAG TPA: hypothetical protein DCG57_17690 [Candidatus Riflebacteria bacterium]|jgi:hypothetical protein|nr:hypothetical protein [Candidatus Riflebacteria bacterium]